MRFSFSSQYCASIPASKLDEGGAPSMVPRPPQIFFRIYLPLMAPAWGESATLCRCCFRE